MSESSQGSAADQEGQWPANNSGGSTRKIVLYGLLALMIVALAYDYLVARPAVNTAYDQITEASVNANRKADSFLSNEDVHSLLGMQPASTFDDGANYVEVFQWRGGLIVKPHKLFAVYTKNGDKWLFYRHAKFAYDKSIDVIPDRTIVPPSDTDAVDQASQYQEDDGGASAPPPRSSSTDSSIRPPGAEAAPARPELESDPPAEDAPAVDPADVPADDPPAGAAAE